MDEHAESAEMNRRIVTLIMRGLDATEARQQAERENAKTRTCECGQPGIEVCYRRGSTDEIWFCGSRKHTPRVRELSAQGWLSQSAAAAASPVGSAIRRRFQTA